MLLLKRKRTKKKCVKKFRRNIHFNETFSVAALKHLRNEFESQKKPNIFLCRISVVLQARSQEFLRAGEFSENKCENSIFL